MAAPRTGEACIRQHVSAAKISVHHTVVESKARLDLMMTQAVDAERILKGRIAIKLFLHLEKCLHTLGTWQVQGTPASHPLLCRALCTTMYIFQLFEGTHACTLSMEALWADLRESHMWAELMADGSAPVHVTPAVAALLRAYPEPASDEAVETLQQEIAQMNISLLGGQGGRPDPAPGATAAAPATSEWTSVDDENLYLRFKVLRGDSDVP